MSPAQPTLDEASRLETLRRYAVLDTLPEQELDDLATLAAQICGTPIALISLVDEHRQWFKSKVGMERMETPRDVSFCGHAIHQRDLFIVPDATRDDRFAGNPLVTGESGVRFYAGAPLVSPEGAAMGALCVMDHVPRTLTPAQEQALRVLARQVMTHLELRRHTHDLAESEARLRIVTDNARVGLVIVNQDRCYIYANDTYAGILGLSSSAMVGRRVSDVLPGIYEEQIRPRLDRAFAGEPVTYDLHQPVEGDLRSYAVRYEPTKGKDGAMLVVVVLTDITERKEVENQLLWKTAFFEAQVNSALDGILVVDSNTHKIVQNQQMADLWNIPPEFTEEVDDRRQFEWVTKQIKNPQQFIEKVAHLHAHPKEISRDELELVNGKVFDRYSAPVLGRDGKLFGRIWTFRDITERKRLDEERDQLMRLIARSPDFIAMADLEGKLIFMNEGARKMIGLGADEDMGQLHYTDYLPEKWQSFFRETVIPTSLEKGVWEGEMQLRHLKNGALVDVFRTTFVIPDAAGQPRFFATVTRDITERKKVEVELRESEARYHTLFEYAPDGILIADAEGRYIDTNASMCRMLGYTRDELVGLQSADIVVQTDTNRVSTALKVIKAGADYHREWQLRRKDGSTFEADVIATMMPDGNLLGMIRDITERKKLEQQFLRSQRMESIGTLAGGIAHDLNNILAPIMLSIDLLKSLSDSPEAMEILETIGVSAKRGSDIVGQVLSFARGIEGERIEIQPRHLLKDVATIIKDTFPKDIRLQFSIAEDTWMILGDPTQIHQILLNLCVNARDAMPNGGSLTIGVENCVLDEQYAAMNLQARPGRYVQISVTDSGMGIPPEILDRIFEPFFTTKELTKGTGLGLSTVMAIVKSHDGIINVQSNLGKGTAFNVYLPATEISSEAPKEKPLEIEWPQSNGETVLLVDDEASILAITSRTLQAHGYRVLTAPNGAEAVALYAQHRDEIAVVLTDMMMPVMNGPATIHALVRINPTIKIIAASGLDAKNAVNKVSGGGVKHFLTKPYTAEALLKTMHAILNEPGKY